MEILIVTQTENCIGCKRCVNVCPSPLANKVKYSAANGFKVTVNEEYCISCGECVKVCETHARQIKDDTSEFMSYIKKNRAALIVPPSVVSYFGDRIKSVFSFFKDCGVKLVNAQIGSEIYAWCYLKKKALFPESIISSVCPAIGKYMEIYCPEKLSSLCNIYSPLACTAIYLRKYLKWDDKIAVISPCMAEEENMFDFTLSLDNLGMYFDRHRIKSEKNNSSEKFSDYDFDINSSEEIVSLYNPGGLRDFLHESTVYSCDGAERVYKTLDSFLSEDSYKLPEILELHSCRNGCMGDSEIFPVFKKRESEKDKDKKFINAFKKDENFLKKYDEILSPDDYIREYSKKQKAKSPDYSEILLSLGKSFHGNCNMCSRGNCEGLACSIAHGNDEYESCLRKEEEFSSKLLSAADECISYSERIISALNTLSDKNESLETLQDESKQMSSALKNLLLNMVKVINSGKGLTAGETAKISTVLEKTADGLYELEENYKSQEKLTAQINDISEIFKNISEEMCVTAYEAKINDKYPES